MRASHIPVMREEALRLLELKPGMRVVDATVGCGGHAAGILERITPGGVLVGLDWDEDALAIARERLQGAGGSVRLHRRNFSELEAVLAEEGIGEVDALLFDLGVSSVQLDTAARGFSFGAPGPLDMRMDRRRRATAETILREKSPRDLERIFRDYGEETLARAIAREIGRAGCPRDTAGLAEIARRVYGRSRRKTAIHPATRVFQALRIAVNEELGNLAAALPQAVAAAAKGARIVVISFHSLEDRIVKEAFAAGARACVCPPGFPVCACGATATLRVITRKPVRPTAEETSANPRARSAKLRAAEKI
jgi:16S rRNA (cytosine1402-N4)-methyltransferase